MLGQDIEIWRGKQAKSLHQGRSDPSPRPVDGPVILKVLGEVGPHPSIGLAHLLEKALSGWVIPALDDVFQDDRKRGL